MGGNRRDLYLRLRDRRRAFVIEDNETMRDYVVEALGDAGYETEAFCKVEPAWEAFERDPASLLLVDWNLPGVPGPQFCQRIRSSPYANLVFVLMVTGNKTPDHLHLALQQGADDYLTKPFRLEELRVRLAVAEKQIAHRMERARAEAERDRQRAFLRTLMDAIPSPVFYKDTKGVYLGGNRAFAEFLQLKPEEIEGCTAHDIAPEKKAAEYETMDRALLEGETESQTYESTVLRADGSMRQVIFNKAKFRAADGSVGGLIGVIQDITDLRQAEQALVRSQQMAAIGTLAAGIAHEFNNINTSIIGNLQLFLETNPSLAGEESLVQRSLRSGMRAANITKRLLAFASPTTGERRIMDLSSSVRETLQVVRGEFQSEGIQVECHLPEGIPVLADGGGLGQVLMNLLINARHALTERPNPRIVLRTGAEGNQAFVSVRDNGCGILSEDLPKLFLPFFSTKGEHAREGDVQSRLRGCGLGLSISQSLVREYGGDIAVESERGEGTCFTVWIPRLSTDQAEAADAATAARSEEPDRHWRGRLLVLDDEEDVRKLLTTALVREGHEVVCFEDGYRALEALAREHFDLALVDLQMNNMGGLEFLRKLRQVTDSPPGAIIISGKISPPDREETARLGVREIVEKPFDINYLRNLVRREFFRQIPAMGSAKNPPLS